MKIKFISPSIQLFKDKKGMDILKELELYGKVCYKSEKNITDSSCVSFISKIINMGHESVLEHAKVTCRVICDRGITHEVVRHRAGASYSQESTRYCNYNNEITFIKPSFFKDDSDEYMIWENCMEHAASYYKKLLEEGCTPQEARTVLPNSLKTEIIATYNLRAWRHFLKLRCSKKAHPQMREIALLLLKELSEYIPIVFDDLKKEYSWNLI